MQFQSIRPSRCWRSFYTIKNLSGGNFLHLAAAAAEYLINHGSKFLHMTAAAAAEHLIKSWQQVSSFGSSSRIFNKSSQQVSSYGSSSRTLSKSSQQGYSQVIMYLVVCIMFCFSFLNNRIDIGAVCKLTCGLKVLIHCWRLSYTIKNLSGWKFVHLTAAAEYLINHGSKFLHMAAAAEHFINHSSKFLHSAAAEELNKSSQLGCSQVIMYLVVCIMFYFSFLIIRIDVWSSLYPDM